jgi:metallo-beta-lactamase family protein
MLEDAARIQEGEAERRNRRADRADEPRVQPLYTVQDAARAAELVRPVSLGEPFDIGSAARARLWNAGHILGAASVELTIGEVRLLFSGDLGPAHKSFEPDPSAPSGIDHLICESTYGDRSRQPTTQEARRSALAAEVRHALAEGGNLVVPVFALERTQELLLDLARLMNSAEMPPVQVFVDSPLASRATRIFDQHKSDLEDLGEGEVFRHPGFHFVESVEESIRLNSVSGAVILSASGMCEAGRIRHHLLHNLPRPDSTILFVGFQAAGTLGRALLDGARRVRISGRDVAVRAEIRRMESYSAHADRGELAAWARARLPVEGSLFLTHGEPAASEALRADLGREFHSILLPEIGETWELGRFAPARRIRTGRTELRDAVGPDWQNDYADFAANLKRRLQNIEDPAARRRALREMRRILEGHADDQAVRRAATR